MTNDYFSFAADLSRAQAGYDNASSDEQTTIPHALCEGTGKQGCSNYCTNSQAEREMCEREHTCFMCGGTGRIPYSGKDSQDDKANESRE